MKRLVFIVLLFVLSFPCFGQDLIIRKDGTDIQAKVVEVSQQQVKYKAWDNPEGPVFIIPGAEVAVIRFENGTNYVMERSFKSGGPYGGYYTLDASILENGNLKYRQLKDYYNKDDYNTLSMPRYSLGLPWLNLLVPGLGQFCMNEPGLGASFLALYVGSFLSVELGAVSMPSRSPNEYGDNIYADVLLLVGCAGVFTAGVLSIVNAYSVAKVKSLYIEDLTNYRHGYSFTLQPSLSLSATPDGYRPAPGLALRMSF